MEDMMACKPPGGQEQGRTSMYSRAGAAGSASDHPSPRPAAPSGSHPATPPCRRSPHQPAPPPNAGAFPTGQVPPGCLLGLALHTPDTSFSAERVLHVLCVEPLPDSQIADHTRHSLHCSPKCLDREDYTVHPSVWTRKTVWSTHTMPCRGSAGGLLGRRRAGRRTASRRRRRGSLCEQRAQGLQQRGRPLLRPGRRTLRAPGRTDGGNSKYQPKP